MIEIRFLSLIQKAAGFDIVLISISLLFCLDSFTAIINFVVVGTTVIFSGYEDYSP